MVIAGDFKVQLVDAQTKQPFKEHYKDGHIYVEVEPGAEYYVRYQKIGSVIKKERIASCLVDGKDLGWRRKYFGNLARTEDILPHFSGSCDFKYDGTDRTRKKTALTFSKVVGNLASSLAASNQQRQSTMGKVEFQLFEKGKLIERKFKSRSSEMSRSRVDSFGVADGSKKQVRSKVSSTSNVTQKNGLSKYKYKNGALLEIITLNYCTFAGLIHYGILPSTGPTINNNETNNSEEERRKRKRDPEESHQEDRKPASYDLTKSEEGSSIGVDDSTGQRRRKKANGGTTGAANKQPTFYDLT